MTSRDSPPSFRVRISAWLALALLMFLAAEFGARLLFPQSAFPHLDRINYSPRAVSGPLLGQATLGHATIRFESAPDQAVSLHYLNLNGFRDREWEPSKTRGKRILMVGDSMVEGFLAREEESIPRVYERLALESGAALEVWNLGIGGAGLDEYVRLLRDIVPAAAPDEVLLVLHANDLLGSANFDLSNPSLSPLPSKKTDTWTPRLFSVIRKTVKKEPLARAWHTRPFGFFAAVPDPANPWTSNSPEFERFVVPEIAAAMRAGRFNPFNVDEVHVFAKYLPHPFDPQPWLEAVKRLLAEHDTKLFIAYIPQTGQASDHYLPFRQQFSKPNAPSLTSPVYQAGAAAVARAADTLAIPFLDLTPHFRDSEERGNRLYWSYDEHLLPAGYAFAAHQLYHWRRQYGPP